MTDTLDRTEPTWDLDEAQPTNPIPRVAPPAVQPPALERIARGTRRGMPAVDPPRARPVAPPVVPPVVPPLAPSGTAAAAVPVLPRLRPPTARGAASVPPPIPPQALRRRTASVMVAVADAAAAVPSTAGTAAVPSTAGAADTGSAGTGSAATGSEGTGSEGTGSEATGSEATGTAATNTATTPWLDRVARGLSRLAAAMRAPFVRGGDEASAPAAPVADATAPATTPLHAVDGAEDEGARVDVTLSIASRPAGATIVLITDGEPVVLGRAPLRTVIDGRRGHEVVAAGRGLVTELRRIPRSVAAGRNAARTIVFDLRSA